MKKIIWIYIILILSAPMIPGQSSSFDTYMNPIIPGDHPDCTLTKIGDDYYTTGSSFNVTPVIYHSTDLVHWEAIAQPVSASWTGFGDSPGGGCWGGQMVYYNGEYWDYFSRANTMHFVKADSPEGPWSLPVMVNNPPELPYGLGYDNSIFIDDDNKWYLVVKNGQPNGGIVELGNDGQPTGIVYNLSWLNPAPDYPYSWAEGPVMWKHNGYYYYSFARDLSGGQKVMRSDTLTADESSWEMLGDFFNENDPQKSGSLFTNPNHSSAVIALEDSTYWVVHPVYAKGEWKGQGRQGLLNQVRYDSSGKPTADYPVNKTFSAPKLKSSGIPWMVPHTDLFNSDKLNPEWSFLGYTEDNSYSLTDSTGWLRLSPKSVDKANTILKNDGEHNYSIITKVNFNPGSQLDEAGLWIMRGDQTMDLKLVSTFSPDSGKTISLSFQTNSFEVKNTIGNTLWLKLVRNLHRISGYYSEDGSDWIKLGEDIDISEIDSFSDFSTFTGTRQGLFVAGNNEAYFDLYIYRDAYTPVLAECTANRYGTSVSVLTPRPLASIEDGDWAMYAGVEFGNEEYSKQPMSIIINASSDANGGIAEIWLDSIDTGTKIADCIIEGTGGRNVYKKFSALITEPVSNNHDVYLRFKGSGTSDLFRIQSFVFSTGIDSTTSVENDNSGLYPKSYKLYQNFPNPFNPVTTIRYSVAPVGANDYSPVQLIIYNLLGQEVATPVNEYQTAGTYEVKFDGSNLASGIYFYRIQAGDFTATKKFMLLK